MRLPTKRIRALRRSQTEAEKAAWYLLRGQRLGLKFRRQVPIDNYVVDFYCFERRLAVELDGSIHAQASQAKKDSAKDGYLRRLGIRVLRLPNGLVLEDPQGFARQVHDAARALSGARRFVMSTRPLTRPPSSGTLSPRGEGWDQFGMWRGPRDGHLARFVL